MEYALSLFSLPRKLVIWGLSGAGQPKAPSLTRRVVFHIHDHFIPHPGNNYQPHLLGHRSLGLLSALLVAVKIFSIGLVTYGPVIPAFSSAITSTNIIALTNASRTSAGLKGLVLSQPLAQAAQTKANDMLTKGYFAHNTPDGKAPWEFIKATGYNYLSAGENLAVNFTEAEDVESAWMNSPGHKANILNSNFEEIGIGIAQGNYEGRAAIFVVQMFGTPVEQKVVINDTPTSVTPASSQTSVVPPALLPSEPVLSSSVISEQKLAEPQTPVQALNPLPAKEELEIIQTSFSQSGSSLELIAQIKGAPVKVLARYGQSAVMLLPKTNGTWSALVDLTSLSQQNTGLVLEAQNMQGMTVKAAVGSFAGSTQDSFKVIPSATREVNQVSFMGKIFDPKNFENQFYLIFIVALLSCLILAIAIKRHVQHLPLIANASLVVVLAVGLWVR